MNLDVDMSKISYNINNDDTKKIYMNNEQLLNHDIAVIGISARIGRANSVKEFWDYISSGIDLIERFPENRQKDVDTYINTVFGKKKNDFVEMAYLKNIDQFDANFFRMAPIEAELLSPVQRVFLEAMVVAAEDAGYGGDQLNGTNTGVYVGYNSNNMNNYFSMISNFCPDKMDLALTGNIDSVIASRFSYLYNLKGPAEVIDTACSSSLVAVHTACQAIRSKEVDMAFAGGIKICLIPRNQEDRDIGITSSSGRTKTFDENADGTGAGEGVGVVLLKPLLKAIEDHDVIHAVIKGSAINQDGSSVGITAPNSQAQTDVLIKAWEDANINPLSIQYYEAHGTATNLGDPIEIEALSKAIRKYTMKKQAFAIGSVKTNVGHLDCASGIAGLINAIMMLKNKKIAPNIHYKRGNKKIDFINSPVYVNDKLRDWEKDKHPRRCGISSFGISGTNCHMILEEAPIEKKVESKVGSKSYLLAISAKTKDALQELMKQYNEFYLQHPKERKNMCYTANTGRGHYNWRMAVVFSDTQESLFTDEELETCKGLFINEVKVGDYELHQEDDRFISYEQKLELNSKAKHIMRNIKVGLEDNERKVLLKKLSECYVLGADIEWNQMFIGDDICKVSIPTYPFDTRRCWINNENYINNSLSMKESIRMHPLIGQCLTNFSDVILFETDININNTWELKEHIIGKNYVLPGTAFVEMLHEAGKLFFKTDGITILDTVFLIPFMCNKEETRRVQIIGRKQNDILEVNIISTLNTEANDNWVNHVSARISKRKEEKHENLDIELLLERCNKIIQVYSQDKEDNGHVKVADSWKTNKMLQFNEDEIIGYFELSSEYLAKLDGYFLYPPLLDGAVNIGNVLTKSGVCLPLSYGKADFFKPLPKAFYSYLHKKKDGNNGNITTFDVSIVSDEGEYIGFIEDYILKELSNLEMRRIKGETSYSLVLKEKGNELINPTNLFPTKTALIIMRDTQKENDIYEKVKSLNFENYITIILSNVYEEINENCYQIRCNEEDFKMVLTQISNQHIDTIIHIASYEDKREDTIDNLDKKVSNSMKSLYLLLHSMSSLHMKVNNFTAVIDNSISVNGKEDGINPINRAFTGMIKSVAKEYTSMNFKVIDLDTITDTDKFCSEILSNDQTILAVFRNNIRYIEYFTESVEEVQTDFEIKSDGVYIIAGGLGGVGLALTQSLVQLNNKIHIAILCRHSMNQINDQVKAKRIQRQLNEIREISNGHTTVEILQADITDYETMTHTMTELRYKYGRILGVINCAGVSGDGYLIRKRWADFYQVLQPKIFGTWILDKLTQQDNLDFFIMCSSLSSIFASSGQSDYAAANSYLDSYSEMRDKKGKPSLAINWTGWKEVGMAVDNQVNQNESIFQFVDTQRGQEAFVYALSLQQPHLIVGELNYEFVQKHREFFRNNIVFSQTIDNKLRRFDQPSVYDMQREEYTVQIISNGNKEVTQTEKTVANAMARTLNFNEINIDDKFFEMGGDSLLATALKKELDKDFPDVVDITDIFTYVSVAEIAKYIDSIIKDQEQKQDMSEMDDSDMELKELLKLLDAGNIDLEDAKKMLIN